MKRLDFILAFMFFISQAVFATQAENYTLDIFGNANMDDTIDEDDIEYVQAIINGTKEATKLTDANFDGAIDETDISQIEQILSGEEKELTFIDSLERNITIKKPITSIVVLGSFNPEAIRVLKATDKLVGIDSDISKLKEFYPNISKLPTVGKWNDPDAEMIINLKPDIVLTYATTPSIEVEDKLKTANIQMVRLNFYSSMAINSINKLSYILDREEEAKANSDYINKYLDIIKSRTEKLSEDEKPKVFMETWSPYKSGSTVGGHNDGCIIASGTNIAKDLDPRTGSSFDVDSEWLIEQNPDIIQKLMSSSDLGYATFNSTKLNETRREIMGRAELANVNAVKNGQVYLYSYELEYVRGFIGTIFMAKWFHPELFEDLDPEAIHKEYLEQFEGIPYKGAYTYPTSEES